MNSQTAYREPTLRPDPPPWQPPRVFYVWHFVVAFFSVVIPVMWFGVVVVIAAISFLCDDWHTLTQFVGFAGDTVARMAALAIVVNIRYGRPPKGCNADKKDVRVALTNHPYYNDGD